MIGSRQIALAVLASLVIELGVLFSAAAWSVTHPEARSVLPTLQREDGADEETVIDLVPVLPVDVALVPAPPRREVLEFVETTGEQNQGTPPRVTNLISDHSTQAAGEGGKDQPDKRPQPEMKGIEEKGLQLANQDFQDGNDDSSEKASVAAAAAPVPPAPAPPPVPPEPPKEVAAVEKPQPDPPPPADRALESIKPMIELPDSLPRLATGTPEEKLRPRPQAQAQPEIAARPPPSEGGGKEPGFRAQKISRALEGTISQKGPASLDVEATPLGRYLTLVSRIVGRDWQRACRRNENLMHVQPGFIRVNFVVGADGKVLRASAVEQRDAGETQKLFTVNAVRQAVLPPIPKDVLDVLEGGQLEVNFNFLFL